MTRIRSRAKTSHYGLKHSLQLGLAWTAIICLVISAVLIVCYKIYESRVNTYLDTVDNILNSESYEVIVGENRTRACVNTEGELIYLSTTNGKDSTQLFMRDNLCYMAIDSMTTREQRNDFGGKTWVYVDKQALMKDGIYKASDLLGCINTELYRKELNDAKIITKGIRYIKYLLSGYTTDTYGMLGSESIVIDDSEKFNEINGRYINVFGDYRELLGGVSMVSVKEGEVEIIGVNGEHIVIKAVTGKSEYDVLARTMDAMSTSLKETGKQREEKFFAEYSEKDIIESLKGAFEK